MRTGAITRLIYVPNRLILIYILTDCKAGNRCNMIIDGELSISMFQNYLVA